MYMYITVDCWASGYEEHLAVDLYIDIPIIFGIFKILIILQIPKIFQYPATIPVYLFVFFILVNPKEK